MTRNCLFHIMLKPRLRYAILALSLWTLFQGSISVQSRERETPLVHSTPPGEFRVPEVEGVSSKLIPDTGLISIKNGKVGRSMSIDVGTFEVQPGFSYRAELGVTSGDNENPVGVSLMIREHPAAATAPFQPYHRTQVNARPLAADTSSVRELDFVTRQDTHALSATLVVTALSGELQLSEFNLFLGTPTGRPMTPEQAKADFEKMMEGIRAAADSRQALTPRPLVFSRSQMKYPLGRNYYHQWNDRPLLVDRKYRVASPYPTPLPSYRRTLQEVKKYDIDGLAFFPETTRRMSMFEAHEKAGIQGVGLLPEFLPGNDADATATKIEILKTALAHPAVPRIDGKVLVTSYAASSLDPEEWKALLATLRKEVGDTFLFLPSLPHVAYLRKAYLAGEPIPRAEVEKQRDVLRAYLDVCDGIYFNYPAAFKRKDHSFDDEFYRGVFIPVFKSVLSEPKYRKKYLGLSAYRSHMSPERGNSLHEDGTRTLRRSFEAAMEARPDVIVLPEWDEQNENTSFRPTLYGGRSTERILRYYMSRIKNQAPTPLPGDDLGLPNLILSSRKAVTLGERAMFELLNVPDSTREERYSAELKLEDPAGGVVHTFPAVEFDAGQLQEHRFHLPTETLPDAAALVPALTVRDYKGQDINFQNGFHHLAIRATWNWDHLFVKQALRDMLRPEEATFALEKQEGKNAGKDGAFFLTGSALSPEPLALVEVLGDDDEVYAVDPSDEFFRNDPTKELLAIDFRSLNRQQIKGTLSLENATAHWFVNGRPVPAETTGEETGSQYIPLKRPASVHQRWIYLALPKADLANAVLGFDIEGQGKFTIPVRKVFREKMVAHGFGGGLHLSLRPYRRQIDMPVSLNSRKTKFRVRVWPEIPTEQFHLRLTSVSGKTYRSRPILQPSPGTPEKKALRIFSQTQRKGLDVEVAARRIPSLAYQFAPRRGAVLLTDAGQPFWATLGGFSNSTTGRGTVNGLFGKKYPPDPKRSDPAWVEDKDGQAGLEFDGQGTYLELPREALPSHGAFNLSFDVKPKNGDDQYLMVNGTVTRQHGLALQIRDGKLHASFLDSDWQSHRWQTELPVPPGVWSSIRVLADFESIAITVGENSESFPLNRPAFNVGFTVFGANWKGKAFAGRLRNLKIEHNSTPKP